MNNPNYLRKASLKNEVGKMYGSLLNGRLNRIKIDQAKRNGLERILGIDENSVDTDTTGKLKNIRILNSLYTREPEIKQRENTEFHDVNKYLIGSMQTNAKKDISKNYLSKERVNLNGFDSSFKVKEYVPMREHLRDARVAVTNTAIKTGRKLFGSIKNRFKNFADYMTPKPNFAYQK